MDFGKWRRFNPYEKGLVIGGAAFGWLGVLLGAVLDDLAIMIALGALGITQVQWAVISADVWRKTSSPEAERGGA